jgi:proteic killer suppression protein
MLQLPIQELNMIRFFKCKETEKIYHGKYSKKFPGDIQQRAMRKLIMLDASHAINDLLVPPSNKLEKLGGNRDGQWSVRINDKYRICFTWSDHGADSVEIVDYH